MKPLTKMFRLPRFLFFPLSFLAIACDGDRPPPSLSLLPGQAQETETDAEAQRLRKMQRITVLVDGVPQDLDDSSLQKTVGYACTTSLPCQTPQNSDGSYCSEACETLELICQAKTYLALTRPQASNVTLPGSTDGQGRTYVIPEQSDTSKQTLAEFGLDRVITAASQFSDMLKTFSGSDPTATACKGSGDFAGTKLQTYAANGFADAFDVYKQLVDAYVQVSVNSADSELNSTASTGLAAERAMTQRLAAARKLGGEVGQLPKAFPGGAFCTRPSAPPAVRAAIAVIRDAAIAPSDLLDSGISISDLIEGIGNAVPHGSVRQRLSEYYWGVKNQTATTLPNGKTVEAQYNLDLSSFQEARAYLQEEITAFARSSAALLKYRVKPDGTFATYASYAGTGTGPVRLPSAYYGALVRSRNSDTPNGWWNANSYNAAYPSFFSSAQAVIDASAVSGKLGVWISARFH